MEPNTLFRSNSIPTKMLYAFTILVGSDYVKAALRQPIKALYENTAPLEVPPQLCPSFVSFAFAKREFGQVDPNKFEDGIDREAAVAQGVVNLSKATDIFLNSIFNSIPKCPRYYYNHTTKKPNTKYKIQKIIKQ